MRIDKHNIRIKPYMGGGVAMDCACYMIEFSRFVFNIEPVSVLAYGYLNSQFKIDIAFNGILDFENGRTATFATSFELPRGKRAHILGTDGEIFPSSPSHFRNSTDAIIVKRPRPGTMGTKCEYEEEVIYSPVVEPFISIIDYL